MARGMFRGMGAAWLGLIALQTFTTTRGAGAVGGMFDTVAGLVSRALDPTVPAIPDHSTPPGVLAPDQGTWGSGNSNGKLNTKGQYIPGDPNGVPGGPPLSNPGTQQDRYSTPFLSGAVTNT